MKAKIQNCKTVGFAFVVILACLFCGIFIGCSSNVDNQAFVGTWDLAYGESADGNEDLSQSNVDSMRSLGLDAYLNLGEDGSLALVAFDGVKQGDWKRTSTTTANATVEGRSATITLTGDTLHLVQQDTTLVFSKGDPKTSTRVNGKDGNREDVNSASGSAEGVDASEGLSELVVKGALLDNPITIVDDKFCTVIVDGVGVDRLGDPGYNVRITNNYDGPIELWVQDPFLVNGVPVKVYFCEAVEPGRSVTSFMQFDTADIKSTSVSSLGEVTGTLLVDDDTNTTLIQYPFNMHPVTAG